MFASIVEEHLFKLVVHRDRALTYKTEEVQLTAVDELYLEQDLRGAVHRMIARVRIFFLGFFSGKKIGDSPHPKHTQRLYPTQRPHPTRRPHLTNPNL